MRAHRPVTFTTRISRMYIIYIIYYYIVFIYTYYYINLYSAAASAAGVQHSYTKTPTTAPTIYTHLYIILYRNIYIIYGVNRFPLSEFKLYIYFFSPTTSIYPRQRPRVDLSRTANLHPGLYIYTTTVDVRHLNACYTCVIAAKTLDQELLLLVSNF